MMARRDDAPPDLNDQIVALLPRLRRFCVVMARSRDGGDDLCQATVERALSRRHLFDPGTRLDSWMYRIAQNLHVDRARRVKTRGQEIDVDEMASVKGDDGVRIVEQRSALERARAAIARLPDDQRALMALVVFDGKSYGEAAGLLDIPIGTVMSRLARARRAIDAYVNGTDGNG
ncbi:RNA polymerase sigma factor [Sphingobium sp. HBC34]|uniref:RNA polymerase sigma factor n=1 Tax=Sphingobium cyanobacteriorum TaxID=3063954 RepID=A0ABT8ZH14_9SPHN|nr:RNA polymerase sigma factor [Sphingobium sp. HBC34]MDO7833837.1 RNA polymerase sigma factor [Sphingobium sp. HBC34]